MQEKLRRQAEGEEGVGSSSASSSDDSDDEEEDKDGLPFACLSCRKRWELKMNPVITQCNHYFCEKCAIDNFKKSRQCPQCGADTYGIFNSATKLIKKIEEKEALNERNSDAQQAQTNSSNNHDNNDDNKSNSSDSDSDRDSDNDTSEEEEEEKEEDEENNG